MDQFLPLLFERHPEPMWLFDPDTERVLAVNAAALRNYGYSREEFLRLTLRELRAPSEFGQLDAALARLKPHADNGPTLMRHRRRDGAALMVEIRSSPVVFQGAAARLVVARDMSRLLALERERDSLVQREQESRARAEAAARLFQTVFESVPGKFLVLAADDLRIVAASNEYLAATMTQRDQILGRPMFEVFPDDPQDQAATGSASLRRSLDQVRATGRADVMAVQRYPIRRPDGGFEERYWSPVNTPALDADGRLAYIIHRAEDVTEFVQGSAGSAGRAALRQLEDRASYLELDIVLRSREIKQANLQLQQRDAMLRNAQRLVAMAGWQLDIATGAFTASDNFCRILGIALRDGEASFDTFLACVHPDDLAAVRSGHARTLVSGAPFELRHRIVRTDGSVRIVRQAAEVVTTAEGRVFTGVLQDVTEESLAAAEARAAFEQLRLAGRIARLGGWRYDSAAGRLEWSAETFAIHGVPEGTQLTVDEAIALYHPDDQPRVRAVFQTCLREGQAFDELARIRTAAGACRSVRIIGEAERDEAGGVRGAQGALQDVSEVVAIREESQRLLQRLRDTLESMSDAFILLDRDYRYTFLNSEAERVLRRARQDLLQQSIWAAFPEMEPALQPVLDRAMASGDAAQVQFHFPQLDAWLDLKAYPTRDGLAIYFRDVSRERQRNAELLLLQAAVARQNDILVITEAASIEGPHGPRIVFVNDSFVRRTGYAREEAIGSTPRILQGPDTDRRELDRIRHALEKQQPVRAELLNYTKAGEPFWLELDIAPIAGADGSFTHWVAVERDVSERKDAEQRARIHEERFRLLSRATNDAIWDWDLVAGQIWWSEGFETLFGYDRSRVPPSEESWKSGIHPDDRPRVEAGIHAVIDGTRLHWSDEYRFLAADGRVLEVNDRGFVIRNEEGRAIRMIGSMTDVTEHRRLEAQLRQAQRLDAVGQLTGGVAHDFNNLLTVILGNAEMLTEELVSHPELGQLAQTTLHAAVRGAELTNRLLAFARKQALHPQPVDIGALLSGMSELLRRTLGEQLEVEITPQPGLWQALVDPAQLEAAVLNLCINARDAMPDGGRLTIESANILLDEAYARDQGELEAGEYVMICVADTGSGMEPPVLARAFEPFFTTKEVGKGSGLGLSMVYGFAKQSRGHVRIDSAPRRGTMVRLYLPRAPGPSVQAPAPDQPGLETGRESILLVEDDELVRAHVTAQLQSLGYRVESVAEPRQALLALQQRPYDLLFTDVVMPGGMNGRQLAEQALRLRPALPVLFTSGYAEVAFDSGMPPPEQLLRKPYRRHELAARVRAMLDAGGSPH